MKILKKFSQRKCRHLRIRKRVSGCAERPRLNVRRSLKGMSAQIIDDRQGVTILGVSTTDQEFRSQMPYGGNVKAANLLGELLARKAQEKKIRKVVFDRGGYDYHGRIKAFAESARKAGLEF